MPLIWISVAFFAGLVLADNDLWPLTFWIWGTVVLLSILIALILFFHWTKHKPNENLHITHILSSALFLTLGGVRYRLSQPDLGDPHFIASHVSSETSYIIVGVVSDFPDQRDHYTNIRVQTQKIRPADGFMHTEVEGLILAKVPPESDVHYGDQILLRGYLQKPPTNEDFSYRDYLARQNIYAYMSRANVAILEADHGNVLLRLIFRLKEKSLATIYRLWPDPEASLLAGILLGIESGIPAPVQKAFKDTGTSHIIAISGFNITIIAGLFSNFFNRFLSPRRGAIAAALGITLYTILVGADAAVLRAAVMGGLTLFAQQIGRRQSGLNALAVASLFMAVFDPQLPWDLSFQLSLTATIGLILYAEPLQDKFVEMASRFITSERAKRLSQPVGEYILFTFAAQLTTFPVMVFHFQRLSLTAFLANPVILPAQPPIMTIGGLALILGLIWFPLGKMVAPFIWPFVLFTIRAVEFFGRYQGGILTFAEIGNLEVCLIFGVIFGLTFAVERFRNVLSYVKPVAVLSVLGVVTVLV